MFYSGNLLLIFKGGSRAAATSKMLQQLHLGCCSSPRSASDLLFRCSTDDLFYDLKKNILEEHFQDRLRNLLLKVMINTYGKNAAEVSFTIGNFLGHLLYFYHHMLHFFQILFKNFSAFNFLAEGFSGNQFYWAFLLGGFFPGDFFPGFFFEDIFFDIVFWTPSDDCFWMNFSSFLLVFTNAFVDGGVLLELMNFLSTTFFTPLRNTLNTVRKPY